MATATVTKGYNNPTGWISGETVTPEKLNFSQTPSVSVTIDDGDITASKLATGAVTGAAGGGKLAASAITAQTAIDALANDDTLLIHDDSNTALRKVTWSQIVAAAQPVGSVLKTNYAELVGVQSYTSGQTLAVGATPTSSSGIEILSISSLSTSSSSNYLMINVSAHVSTSTSGGDVAIFLFAGSTLIASQTTYIGIETEKLSLLYKYSPASTSSVTYTVRAACDSGTLFINRSRAGTPYNTGKQVSSMLIQEIKG
jgi:hypothetical protein